MEQRRAVNVFVSYRRQDTNHLAGRLFDRLADRFGPEHVFMDVDSIAPGSDYHEAISRAVAEADVLLALIGPRWEGATDKQGRSRLADPGDLVRTEIQAALVHGIRLIPVLVDGAAMPDEDALPVPLRALGHRQAVRLDHPTFRWDVEALIAATTRAVETGDPPMHRAGQPAPPSPTDIVPGSDTDTDTDTAPVPRPVPPSDPADTGTPSGRPRSRVPLRGLVTGGAIVVLVVVLAVLDVLGVLGSSHSTGAGLVGLTTPAAPPPATVPSAAIPSATVPPSSSPAASSPVVVAPPATTPPASRPPATRPPATHRPATQPSVSRSPVTHPPVQQSTTPSPTPALVDVPDVTGMAPPDASHALDRAGFDNIDVEHVTVSDPHQDGEVISQSPSPGTPSDPIAPVLIKIGRVAG